MAGRCHAMKFAMSYYPYLFREQLVVFFCSLVTLGVLFYLLGKIATHQLLELNKRIRYPQAE